MDSKLEIVNKKERAIRDIYSKLSFKERKLLENRDYHKESIIQLISSVYNNNWAFLELFQFIGTKYQNSGFINTAVLPNYRKLGELRKLLSILQLELINYNLESDYKIDFIYWGVYKNNLISIKIAKKYGFTFEKVYYNQLLYKMTTKQFLNINF